MASEQAPAPVPDDQENSDAARQVRRMNSDAAGAVQCVKTPWLLNVSGQPGLHEAKLVEKAPDALECFRPACQGCVKTPWLPAEDAVQCVKPAWQGGNGSRPHVVKEIGNFEVKPPNGSEYDERRRKVELQVQMVRAQMAADTDETVRWSLGSSSKSEFALRDKTDYLPLSERRTALKPHEVPVPFSAHIPVILHKEASQGQRIVRLAPMLKIPKEFGDDSGHAVIDALKNLTMKGACCEGMTESDVYRHVLGVYLMHRKGKHVPASEMQSLVAWFNEQREDNIVIRSLIDPMFFGREINNIQLGIAVWEDDSVKVSTYAIAFVLVLVSCLDIWHPANYLSPGHRTIRLRLKRSIPKVNGKKMAKTLDLDIRLRDLIKDIEDNAPSKEEVAFDEKFKKMIFLDVLEEEKSKTKSLVKRS